MDPKRFDDRHKEEESHCDYQSERRIYTDHGVPDE